MTQKIISKSNCHHLFINITTMLGSFLDESVGFFAPSSLNQICQFVTAFKESSQKCETHYVVVKQKLSPALLCVCLFVGGWGWRWRGLQVCLCVFQPARVQSIPGLITQSEPSRCKLSFKYLQPSLISLQAEGFSKHVYQVFSFFTHHLKRDFIFANVSTSSVVNMHILPVIVRLLVFLFSSKRSRTDANVFCF